MPAALIRGDRLPRMKVAPPGPRSRHLARVIASAEAPVVNTLFRGEPSIVWREALGSNVLDVDDNLYVDLTSGFGVAAVGHRHPAVVEAVHAQVDRLLHGLADVASHPARIELAERLCGLAPMKDPRVYFAISGSDAVEIALKTAWLATGRERILAFEPAYHGSTLGALAMTSRDAFRRPFMSRLNPEVSRLSYGAPAAELESALGSDDIAAAIVEPLIGREGGREGIGLPPARWLAELSNCCARHDTLLIADEIFTGLGRTGRWFACEREGVTPDLLCCGKALGGGLPIAAVLGRGELMRHWDRRGEALHTATFLANPPACSAALAALNVLEVENLPRRAAELGVRAEAMAEDWRPLDSVRSVIGRGLFWTIEVERQENAAWLARSAVALGLLLLTSGRRIQLMPPLVITDRQWDHALEILDTLVRDLAGRG